MTWRPISPAGLAPLLLASWLAGSLPGCGEQAPPAPEGTDACPNDLPSSDGCPSAAPAYAAVSGIIEERCTLCHHSGNPYSSKVLGSYEQAYAERRGMLTQIYGCRMPPSEAPQLSTSERGALLRWLVCGAPRD